MKSLLVASAALAGAFAFTAPALAFECAKASTKTEKAICADAPLKAADDAMSAAYDTLIKRIQGDQPAMLKASQRNWLKRRDDSCAWNDDQKGLTACLLDMTKGRTAMFEGAHLAGPGVSVPLTPWFYARPQSKTQCSADVSVYKFSSAGSPGEKAFNAAVDVVVQSVEADNGAREATPEFEYDCFYSIDASIPYASDDLVNTNLAMDMYGGGAHGMSTATALTVDLKAGKILGYGDVFGPNSAKTLIDSCTAEIKKEKTIRFQDAGDPESAKEMLAGLDEEMKGYAEAIAGGVKDFSRWTIQDDGATIYFPPYEVGSFAEGPYSCKLPKNLLQLAAGVKGWIVP